jgi:hypothetical protein
MLTESVLSEISVLASKSAPEFSQRQTYLLIRPKSTCSIELITPVENFIVQSLKISAFRDEVKVTNFHNFEKFDQIFSLKSTLIVTLVKI